MLLGSRGMIFNWIGCLSVGGVGESSYKRQYR